MADKQAFVYIIDLGSSMSEHHNGREESDLDYGMRYIWDKIATTLSAGRKTFTVGVIGLKTDETRNILQDEAEYEHISVLQDLGPMFMPELKTLQDGIQVNQTDRGDAFSAIVVAIDMIEKFTKKLKYSRKIFLLTNGHGAMDPDGIDDIAKKLNEENIELIVVGVDFDDAEYGFKEEDKDSEKAINEVLLKSLTDQCDNAVFGTAAEAIDNLSIPTVKESRPYASFKGKLTLGDPEKYDSAMAIDVERYFRTHLARAPSASNYVAASNGEHGDGSLEQPTAIADADADGMDDAMIGEGAPLSSVKNLRTYKVIDESAPGGRRDVEREELAKGYEYGRTAVHISESDENVTKLETVQGFSIIGFIPCEKYDRFLNMGEAEVTVASKVNDKARMALSSLIHALHELESYAVARIVVKDGKDPKLVLLAPSIEPELECLIDVPLPFAEDVRSYRFPPLDRVVTVTGQVLKTHRNLPTDDLSKAMDAYVDNMDLSNFGTDDEGEPAQYMPIEDSYSVVLHRINQAIRRRAVQPNEEVQPVPEFLLRYSQPPAKLISKFKPQLQKLIATAGVKKVPLKVKGRRGRGTIKPLSGLDIDALLSTTKRQKISPENSIPEFKQMLATAESLSIIETATSQMSSIIRTFITHSLGDSGYARALENLGVLREALLELEEPGLYNDFVKDLKARLLKGELGGDRRELWFMVRGKRLGLIDKGRLSLSDIEEAEAAEFYSMKNA